MQDFRKQFILALLSYGAQRSINPEQVCQQSGIDYKALTREGTVIVSQQQTEQLWKNLSHQAKDSLFGLHFGESMQLAAIGIVGQIIQTSSTVGEALTNAGALIGFITDLFSMQLEHEEKSFSIHLPSDQKKSEDYPYTYRHMADYLMVFIVHELDGLLLQRIQPMAVQFPYSITEQNEYARVFRTTVQQKTNHLSIELDNSYWSQPIISANYELQNHLLQKINSILRDSKEEGTLQTKIFNYLLSNSYLYSMSLEAVAANFHISPRTLQRKLKDEGVSYLQIVEDVRQRLAIHYLTSGNYQVKDVAYTLGYNEQSAFIRAFKRWTGQTPMTYVANHKNAEAAITR